jgi:hypothetical protein
MLTKHAGETIHVDEKKVAPNEPITDLRQDDPKGNESKSSKPSFLSQLNAEFG